MLTLTLLRHANSGYVDGLTDFKRHLTERGRRDALNMAKALRDRDCIPTALLVSSAVRTRETAQILRDALGLQESSITHLSDLYLATPDVLIREINHATDTPHLMLIGHNPGLESLSTMLDPDSPERMTSCSLNHFKLIEASAEKSNSPGTQHDSRLTAPRPRDVENAAEQGEAGIRPLTVRGCREARLSFHQQPCR